MQFLKSESFDLNELLANCCLNRAVNCFELLRTEFNVEITKKCLDNAVKGNNQYIIQECLNEQNPDTSTIEAAIASHDIDTFMSLIDDYNIQFSEFHMPILPLCYDYLNLHVFLVYLLHYNDLDGCLRFSPVFHIRDLCRYLYNNGGNVLTADPHGATALHTSIFENQIDIAKDFISYGSDIEAKVSLAGRPLNFAVSNNNTAMVELLVSHGANVNINDPKNDFSLLHIATILKNKNIIEILIKNSVQVNGDQNKYNLTPIFLASLLNYKEIVQLLISHGARISKTDKFGNNAVAYALLYNNNEFMKRTLNQFHSVTKLINYKTFDLESNNTDLIDLLSYSANVNGQNTHKNSPLHIAALMSNKENAEKLISHGADINSLNKNGQTPLDIAIMRCQKDYGQDFLDFEEENNQNSLDFCQKKSEMVALLTLHHGYSNSIMEFKSNNIVEIMFDYFWERREIRKPSVTLILVEIEQ
ncbi:hypothetical protein TVAG_491560 [Trichomonas vaginalis G3]|uniref:DUF3447 domain-containing protein n=1 Tax=Trichomonas vaginalis (strain ATCC PRA-98 / G3) TaxID=412133 RepID=A2EAI8_TRIV3|nr:spectrin binding [Trichomonas vaginalis G3]EAY10299.1 hypothetical protein TVAG_491560 [Trichomonas vaginalis G3]KAI5491137.1 spectrin binding [Trichomonas vaginalis G3]|eukprot:XP_001322522.1 hypothetical protein [Trichomonas vaginalis G3]